jgi:thiol-disulfide isomerase/thioredoxin
MKRIAAITLAVAFVAFLAATFPNAVSAADKPADRVVAIYFHRTERCPTCKKMGSYSEEAVKKAFAKQIKDGTVEFFYIDYQNKKNAALKKGYKVTDPALIVAKIVDNKVKAFKDLPDIWEKVGDKPAFMKYVQANVEAYRK